MYIFVFVIGKHLSLINMCFYHWLKFNQDTKQKNRHSTIG